MSSEHHARLPASFTAPGTSSFVEFLAGHAPHLLPGHRDLPAGEVRGAEVELVDQPAAPVYLLGEPCRRVYLGRRADDQERVAARHRPGDLGHLADVAQERP